MMSIQEATILLTIAMEDAVRYVGYANYSDRERHALKEVNRNMKAFTQGRYDEIRFNEGERQKRGEG